MIEDDTNAHISLYKQYLNVDVEGRLIVQDGPNERGHVNATVRFSHHVEVAGAVLRESREEVLERLVVLGGRLKVARSFRKLNTYRRQKINQRTLASSLPTSLLVE